MWISGAIIYFRKIGIKGRMLNWLKDFLEKRKIKVRYEGHVTETVETLNGCPQGSVLSPIIFSLLMNSLQETIEDHNQKEENILDNIVITICRQWCNVDLI